MNVTAALRSAAVTAAVQADAIVRYPKESCGFVTPTGYVPMANTAADPQNAFKIPTRAWLKHQVLAVVHSHPDGPDVPSASDMRGQIDSAVPWGLVVTDGERVSEPYWWGAGIADDVPLVGRRFRHGPTGTDGRGDCYACIRDWYRMERAISLPEVPRDAAWWRDGGDLYREGFGKAGFVDLGSPQDHLRDFAVGDVLLFQIRSDVPNHGGIYIGDGRMIHHPEPLDRRRSNELCRTDPVARYIHAGGTQLLRHTGTSR